jgi:enamine deaminase RidA (YjgF/YER057c/UK114 family)
VTQRHNISSGVDFESVVGYSRAVRIGPVVAVAGTTGAGEDIAAQARDALRRIENALGDAGAQLSDVIRTRMFVTDISRWRDVAVVHAEVFGHILPVATMVEVTALISPELLIEIEVDAYVGATSATHGSRGPEMNRPDPAGKA